MAEVRNKRQNQFNAKQKPILGRLERKEEILYHYVLLYCVPEKRNVITVAHYFVTCYTPDWH